MGEWVEFLKLLPILVSVWREISKIDSAIYSLTIAYKNGSSGRIDVVYCELGFAGKDTSLRDGQANVFNPWIWPVLSILLVK